MKLQYIFFLLAALFITGLADGISWALAPIPGLGFVLGIAIAFCINITMGVGFLLPLLVLNDLYHPRFGPFGIIAGLIPGLNVLPFWVGLVVAGIMYKMNAEGEDLGKITNTALKLQSVYQSDKNPFKAARDASSLVLNSRRASGRPEMREEVTRGEAQPESPQQNRPALVDIAPPHTHAQPA